MNFGRHIFGAAAIGFGSIALAWHDFNAWQQLHDLWRIPGGPILLSIVAAIEILGGAAIQFRKTARLGATALLLVYLFFALRWIPQIIAGPQTYDNWGNFFEQFSLVTGALMVFGSTVSEHSNVVSVAKYGRILFGLCVISFTLEQLVYLNGTAEFVPAWLPPGQMFWAMITTVAFAFAAVALLSGVQALLAAQLTTVMIVAFGLLVWFPRLVAHPGSHVNWGGNAENWAIAGAAWVLADVLRNARRPRGLRAELT
jgi:hypothetical protein